MTVNFKNAHLEELYTTGKSKKYKTVPPDVVRKLPLAVIILKQSKVITDIWRHPSCNFEKLKGTNQYSMRLGRTWRLIMEIDWTNDEKTIGIIGLEDLTHHYQ
ncbi:MAG: type II toxin-antitoxin system RelE/ParE family toxin [Treponema sp.]|nr:type II toxin-antitoxin system RelE/ParE family toxin [Treponema sp.]